MKADLLASELISNPSKEPDTLYKQYHSTLSTLIDKHAPLHTKHTKAKYIPGWVNDTVIAAKETKCLFERIWGRDKSTFNRSRYMQKVHQYNRICLQAKSQFLKAKIQDNHNNPQKLWRVLGDVLYRLPDPPIDKAPSAFDWQVCGVLHRKNTLNILCFCQFATHHPWLSSPHVLHFFDCNRGSSY